MGDPACHLSSVCLSCGRFVEEAEAVCPHCAAAVDGTGPRPLFTARQINSILYCAEFGATVEFYRDLLRLEVAFANEWFVEFRLGNASTLSIADAARTTIEAAQGRGMTLSLKVDNLEGLRERLIGLGIEPTPVSERFGSSVFDVHDPEGHRIEFWAD